MKLPRRGNIEMRVVIVLLTFTSQRLSLVPQQKMLKKKLALPILRRNWSHQSPLVLLFVLLATLKTKPKEASQSLQKTLKHRPRKTKLKEASQSLQKTPKHKLRSSRICFTSLLIKLWTESISDRMIKFASTRGYHPTKFSLQH